jgi:hypothetical protein
MHTSNIWHKQHLYGKKIIVFFLLLCCFLSTQDALAQNYHKNNKEINLPDYEKRVMQYGFFVGLHSSTYRLNYSPAMFTSEYANLQSIMVRNFPAFALGFVVNYHFLEFLDIRLLPKVGFYEWHVNYNHNGKLTGVTNQAVEATFVELPIMFKFKSQRRGNNRMYLIGGVTPSFEASGKKEQDEQVLETRGVNLAVEYGFGLDMYFPLFKFAPEIRIAHGLVNMRAPGVQNFYTTPIRSLYTHSVTLYLHFEGGR